MRAFITKFQSQFKRGFTKVILTRADRRQDYITGLSTEKVTLNLTKTGEVTQRCRIHREILNLSSKGFLMPRYHQR